MGGHYYYYFVPYQEDVNSALQALRKQEFEAGRYNPAIPFPFDDWPSQTLGTAQGAKHASIEGALEDSEADGTRSILDMERVGTRAGFGVVVQLSSDKLMDLYEPTRPSHQLMKENLCFFKHIELAPSTHTVVYKDDRPSEL